MKFFSKVLERGEIWLLVVLIGPKRQDSRSFGTNLYANDTWPVRYETIRVPKIDFYKNNHFVITVLLFPALMDVIG